MLSEEQLEELKGSIDAAIRDAHAKIAPELMVSGWVLTTQAVSLDMGPGWARYTTMSQPDQSLSTTLGLQRAGSIYTESSMRELE